MNKEKNGLIFDYNANCICMQVHNDDKISGAYNIQYQQKG